MTEHELAIFTICSNHHVARARILVKSAANHHPRAKLFLVLVDDLVDRPNFYPEGCEVVVARDLGIPHFETMAFAFSAIQLIDVLKPFAILHLLSLGVKAILYFRFDVEIHRCLDSILRHLDGGASYVLTPYTRYHEGHNLRSAT